MAYDSERADLVLKPLRYVTTEDATIEASYPTSREFVIDTNLDASGAASLAAELFSRLSPAVAVFDVPIEGLVFLEDFTDGPPRFTLSFRRFPAAVAGRTYTAIGAKPDFNAGTTLLTVRG